MRVSNAGAISLYERLGFERRGVRRGYYTDNREDALIMWRDPAVRGRGRKVILGLETSCDETAAALVSDDGEILANVVASQSELHARYGGVVPEVASRRHLELVSPVVREALGEAGATLGDVERVAVTQGPGLIGALLVGLAAAKGIAWGRGLPLVAGRPPARPRRLALPPAGPGRAAVPLPARERRAHPAARRPGPCGFRVLGTTLDDAAGEAFDKGARLLGLGYPGGAEIDRLAREGDADAFDFPVARVPGLDFSFSGVKTALLYAVRDLRADELEERRADLAASYQRAIVRALVERTREAAEQLDAERIAIVGGVAANSELRAALAGGRAAPLALCTDNAAMIASAARYLERCRRPAATGRVCGGVSSRTTRGARRRGRHGRRARPGRGRRAAPPRRGHRGGGVERARRRPARAGRDRAARARRPAGVLARRPRSPRRRARERRRRAPLDRRRARRAGAVHRRSRAAGDRGPARVPVHARR